MHSLNPVFRWANLKTPSKFARIALNNLFEISPDAIFVTDADGLICDANQQATEHFGYTHLALRRSDYMPYDI